MPPMLVVLAAGVLGWLGEAGGLVAHSVRALNAEKLRLAPGLRAPHVDPFPRPAAQRRARSARERSTSESSASLSDSAPKRARS